MQYTLCTVQYASGSILFRTQQRSKLKKVYEKTCNSPHTFSTLPDITSKWLWCVVIGWTQSRSLLSDWAQFKILSWKWSVLEVTLVCSRQGAEQGHELQACGWADSSIFRGDATGAAPEPHTTSQPSAAPAKTINPLPKKAAPVCVPLRGFLFA